MLPSTFGYYDRKKGNFEGGNSLILGSVFLYWLCFLITVDSSKIAALLSIVKFWASLILQSNKVRLPVRFDKPKKADRIN